MAGCAWSCLDGERLTRRTLGGGGLRRRHDTLASRYGRRTKTASIAQALPPVVDILSPEDGDAVSSPTITLKYFARTPDDAPLTGIRVRVNGQAMSLPGGHGLTAAKSSGVREVTAPIPPQDNVVRLFAGNYSASFC